MARRIAESIMPLTPWQHNVNHFGGNGTINPIARMERDVDIDIRNESTCGFVKHPISQCCSCGGDLYGHVVVECRHFMTLNVTNYYQERQSAVIDVIYDN